VIPVYMNKKTTTTTDMRVMPGSDASYVIAMKRNVHSQQGIEVEWE
jgi:hypothetical protein